MSEPYIDEFLYRGRPPGSSEPPGWHVVLAVDGTDGFGRPFRDTIILNMAQAQERGLDLPSILSDINMAQIVQVETLQAQLALADATIAKLTADLEAATVPPPEPAAT